MTNFVDYSPQNSRGFRALKVWMTLSQMGRSGYERLLADDMALARELYDRLAREPDFELVTCSLSIVTFRYVPPEILGRPGPDPDPSPAGVAILPPAWRPT